MNPISGKILRIFESTGRAYPLELAKNQPSFIPGNSCSQVGLPPHDFALGPEHVERACRATP